MNTIRIVLLDYDLTLMNSIYDFYDAVNTAVKKYGGEPVVFDYFYRLLIEHRLDELIPRGVSKVDFWKYFRKVYRSMTGIPVRGAYRFLLYTSMMGLLKIIVSGRENHPLNIWLELRRHGLDEYIDEVYTLYDLEVMGGVEEELFDKAWLIKVILKKWGVTPCEAVYIGDYRQDYISSLKTGVEFIGVAFSRERAECLRSVGVERIAMDLEEALYYLLDIMRKRRGEKEKRITCMG